EIENPVVAHYNHIPYILLATVEFDYGDRMYGGVGGKEGVVMSGRLRLYEGYDYIDISYRFGFMHRQGIKNILIPNAACAINLNYKKGDVMLIEDDINLQCGSPLAFRGVGQFGERFVDMSNPYDVEMKKKLNSIAKTQEITLQKGVYASVVGPQLETK